MKNNRIAMKLRTAVFALGAAAGCFLMGGAKASPIVVQPGSAAVYKYLPAPTPENTGTAPAATGDTACFDASGQVIPPTGTVRFEAILVGGGGAGGASSSGYAGGGGGSGYISTYSAAYTTGSISFVIGAAGRWGRGGNTTLTYKTVTTTAAGGYRGCEGQDRCGGSGGSGGGGGGSLNDNPSVIAHGGGGGAGYGGLGGVRGSFTYSSSGPNSDLRGRLVSGRPGGANGGYGDSGGTGQGAGYGGTAGYGAGGHTGGLGGTMSSPALIPIIAPCNTSTDPSTDMRAGRNYPYFGWEATGYGAGGGGGYIRNSDNDGDYDPYMGGPSSDGGPGAQGVVLLRYFKTP